ncbi:MAG TPA: hypothetical protein VF657_20270 [Actinoplanes sp.]
MLRRQAGNQPWRGRPTWDGPTVNELSAPLLARGQVARSRAGRTR